jgi:hypothetical protein
MKAATQLWGTLQSLTSVTQCSRPFWISINRLQTLWSMGLLWITVLVTAHTKTSIIGSSLWGGEGYSWDKRTWVWTCSLCCSRIRPWQIRLAVMIHFYMQHRYYHPHNTSNSSRDHQAGLGSSSNQRVDNKKSHKNCSSSSSCWVKARNQVS